MIEISREDAEILASLAEGCIAEYSSGAGSYMESKRVLNNLLDKLGKPAQYTEKGNYIFEGFDLTEDDDD
jgi:hypothetical protein